MTALLLACVLSADPAQSVDELYAEAGKRQHNAEMEAASATLIKLRDRIAIIKASQPTPAVKGGNVEFTGTNPETFRYFYPRDKARVLKEYQKAVSLAEKRLAALKDVDIVEPQITFVTLNKDDIGRVRTEFQTIQIVDSNSVIAKIRDFYVLLKIDTSKLKEGRRYPIDKVMHVPRVHEYRTANIERELLELVEYVPPAATRTSTKTAAK